MAQYRATVRDSARLRAEMPIVHLVQARIAAAEKRWVDAVTEARLSDSLPDGPAHQCAECLPRTLMYTFADAGMADSAIAAYEAYRRTPWGARKYKGHDIGLDAPLLERMGRMYEMKGDTTHAAEFYAQFVERWKNADPELQPRVAAAREKLRRMSLDAPKPR
jgi:hypothetical protein